MRYFIQQGSFVVRFRYLSKFTAQLRNARYAFQGMRIGKSTFLPRINVTWPHQVSLGNKCKIEPGVYFKFVGIWRPGPAIVLGDNVFIGSGCEFNIHHEISIGDDSLIASGCRFIDHDHGILPGELIRLQKPKGKAIKIGKNVWLGYNAVILKGVEIGDGAVVAAGAIVTKSILPMEIWGGVPAKKIGMRDTGNTET